MRNDPSSTRPVLTARGMFERYTVTVGGEKQRHAYLLVAPQTRDAVLIDAPTEAELLQREAAARHARVRMILLTHGHPGRWGALGALRDAWGATVGIHLDDADMLPLTPNFALTDSQRIGLGVGSIEILHAPGHTRGSVCFLADGCVISGSALPTQAPDEGVIPVQFAPVPELLRQRLFTLPASAPVLPARGAITTAGTVRATLRERGQA